MKRGVAAFVFILSFITKAWAIPPKDSTNLDLYQKYFNDSLKLSGDTLLYRNVFEWLGTPYRYGGISRKGIDCSGFVKVIYEHAYRIKLTGGSATIFEQVKKIEKDSLREGDLLFFKTRGNRISHVGVYLRNNKFAHAATKRGIVIDDLNDHYYTQKFHSAGRHLALEKQVAVYQLQRIQPIEPQHFKLLPANIRLKSTGSRLRSPF